MDVYASHLATLNAHHQITATEDICTAQGLKLLSRGARLDETTLTRLAVQKLLKPLGESVGIGGELNGAQLAVLIGELAAQHGDGAALLRLLPLPLSELCSSLDRQPLLCQRLTVMRAVFPARFRRTLFGAVLALAMVKSGQLRGLSLPGLFVAALARSIGLLHLPEALMNREVQGSVEEQRQYESHPVISREMIRRNIDPVTAEAILNQHERLDGSGFPRGWRVAAPGLEAQLLGVADFIAWLWLERLEAQASRIAHVLEPLRLLRLFWSGSVFNAACTLIQTLGSDCPPLVEEAERPAWLATLLARQRQMGRQLALLLEQPGAALGDESSPGLRQRSCLLETLQRIATSSGLLSPEYERWINHVREQQLSIAYAEMDQVYLQLSCLEPLLQRTRLLCGAPLWVDEEVAA
jgi:hypothetical protein